MGSTTPLPLRVVVAAGPDQPGVEDLLLEARSEARRGADVRVLLAEDGLALLSTAWPAAWAADGVRAVVCGRSARARRTEPASVPSSVGWSSLTVFLGDARTAGARLWGAFS